MNQLNENPEQLQNQAEPFSRFKKKKPFDEHPFEPPKVIGFWYAS